MKELVSNVFLINLENMLSRSGSSALSMTTAHSPRVITAFLLKEDLKLSTSLAVSTARDLPIVGVRNYA
jgi:hypothetical protein